MNGIGQKLLDVEQKIARKLLRKTRQHFWIGRRKKVQKFLLLSKRKHVIIPVGNLKVD